jgi:perosamine synthetase
MRNAKRVLEDEDPSRDEIMAHLRARGIGTRPFVYPLHTLPPYRHPAMDGGFLVAERLARRGVNLPTGPD